MRVTIHCTDSPHLVRWVTVLVDEGWKLTNHDADSITAKHHLGQSEHPPKNTTVWYIAVVESGGESAIRVDIDVPAFCHSPFSRARIYDEFDDLATQVGDVTTEEELKMDLLGTIRS